MGGAVSLNFSERCAFKKTGVIASDRRLMKKRGVSFLEAVIALGILSLVIFSAGILIPLAQTYSFKNTNRTTALTLANNMMEKIRAVNFEDVDTDSEYRGSINPPVPAFNEGMYYRYPPHPYPSTAVDIYYPGPGSTSILCHNVIYSFDVSASLDRDKKGNTMENLKKVDITVRWNEPGRLTGDLKSSVTLSSKIIKR